MAIAYIGSTAATTPTAPYTAITTDPITTSGDLLVAVVASKGSADGTVSDSKVNTWTPLTAKDSGTNHYHNQIFYAYNTGAKVGASHTFTVDFGGAVNFPMITVAWFSGSKTSSDPFDQQNGAATQVAGQTLQTNSVTPGEANELIISGATNDSAAATSIAEGGQTWVLDQNTGGGFWFPAALAHSIQTSIVAANPTWTFVDGTVGGKCAVIATFKAAATGGGGPITSGGSLTHGALQRGGRMVP